MNSIIDETPAEDDGESTIFGDIDPSELNLNEGDALAEDTEEDGENSAASDVSEEPPAAIPGSEAESAGERAPGEELDKT